MIWFVSCCTSVRLENIFPVRHHGGSPFPVDHRGTFLRQIENVIGTQARKSYGYGVGVGAGARCCRRSCDFRRFLTVRNGGDRVGTASDEKRSVNTGITGTNGFHPSIPDLLTFSAISVGRIRGSEMPALNVSTSGFVCSFCGKWTFFLVVDKVNYFTINTASCKSPLLP